MYDDGKSGIDCVEQYLRKLHPYMTYEHVKETAYKIRVRHIEDKAKHFGIKLGG